MPKILLVNRPAAASGAGKRSDVAWRSLDESPLRRVLKGAGTDGYAGVVLPAGARLVPRGSSLEKEVEKIARIVAETGVPLIAGVDVRRAPMRFLAAAFAADGTCVAKVRQVSFPGDPDEEPCFEPGCLEEADAARRFRWAGLDVTLYCCDDIFATRFPRSGRGVGPLRSPEPGDLVVSLGHYNFHTQARRGSGGVGRLERMALDGGCAAVLVSHVSTGWNPASSAFGPGSGRPNLVPTTLSAGDALEDGATAAELRG